MGGRIWLESLKATEIEAGARLRERHNFVTYQNTSPSSAVEPFLPWAKKLFAEKIANGCVVSKPLNSIAEVWAENLPEDCPTSEATHLEPSVLMRLARQAQPTPECFLSHAALGKSAKGDIDPCTLASCSTFLKDANKDFINAIKALPKFKKFFYYVYFMNVDATAGRGKINKKSKHVDLWMYQNFDPVAATFKVETLP